MPTPGEHPAPDPGAPARSARVPAEHWSRSRGQRNREALQYYRERSGAPGVAEGGAERNHYCMACDGVIPHPAAGAAPSERCPHCGEPLEERARRYFNWVEIAEPGDSDARALLPIALAALALFVCVALILWTFLGAS